LAKAPINERTYQQQKNSLQLEFRHSNETVLNLLVMLGREAMLTENYALIEWFLKSWGQAHENIVSLQMINDSGFLIADYLDPDYRGEIVNYAQQVDIAKHQLFTLRMGTSEQQIQQQLQQLMWQLLMASALATMILGLSIWLLLRRFAITPLEKEIEQRKAMEQQLDQQRQFLQNVIDGVNDGIMVIDNNYEVLLSNHTARRLGDQRFVVDPDHPKCYELSHHRDTPCTGEDHPCPLEEVWKSRHYTTVLHNHPREDGSPGYYELAASPLWGLDGELQGIIESSRDLTAHLLLRDELEEKKEHLEYLAHHDILTDLPNRLLLLDRLSQGIRKAHRNKLKMGLLFIDLDNFKQINDSFGHDVGDEVLKVVAGRLRRYVREEDTVARLGGDEFNVALLDLHHEEDAGVIAGNLVHEIQKPCIVAGEEFVITTSIGISVYPQDADNPSTLMRNADTAMFRAKEGGRNNFQFYSEEMTIQAYERVVMEKQLRNAIEEEQFELHYQPQYDLKSRQITGLEALIRWNHPEQGLIPPARFIPLAESTGLVIPMGEWVLRSACAQMQAWRAEGLEPGRVAVNLAGKQLQKADLLQTVLGILNETGCQPQWLELEITEGFLMEHPEPSIETLKGIRASGIEIAIDDFGTGYSSLAYLKQLPIDRLKIDQSFVRDIPEDTDDMAITRAVIALGKSLDMKLIAEGVETETQQSFLAVEGCHEAQGYLFSRPLPAGEMTRLLSNRMAR